MVGCKGEIDQEIEMYKIVVSADANGMDGAWDAVVYAHKPNNEKIEKAIKHAFEPFPEVMNEILKVCELISFDTLSDITPLGSEKGLPVLDYNSNKIGYIRIHNIQAID